MHHSRSRTAALLTLTLLVTSCSRQQAPARGSEDVTVVPVAAEPARRGRLRAVLHVSGTVTAAPDGEFLVVAPEAARILEVTKAQGDTVAAGELLVRFELPGAAQEISRHTADVARLQAQVENARLALSRARDFVERGLVARTELNTAERELAEAQASLARSESARAAAEQQAARATVVAPFAGQVAARFHAAGELAQPSAADPVLRLVDPRRLEVIALVPRNDAARVVPGASARLATQVDGRDVPLTVSAAPNPADATSDGSLRVRLFFSEPANVPVDTSVQLDIDAEERVDVVFVSPDAIVKSGPASTVFVANGDVAQQRTVTTGVANEQGVEITEGLNPGDLVITRGQAGLSDGAKISATVTR